jgi:hypothetical protein
LTSKGRFETTSVVETAEQNRTLESRLRILSPDVQLTPELRRRLTATYSGCDDEPCVLTRIDQDRLLLVVKAGPTYPANASIISLKDLADPEKRDVVSELQSEQPGPTDVDLTRATVEIRTVERRQAFVDGKPVGSPFR